MTYPTYSSETIYNKKNRQKKLEKCLLLCLIKRLEKIIFMEKKEEGRLAHVFIANLSEVKMVGKREEGSQWQV